MLITFRRALVGLWRSRHRNQRLWLASAVTGMLGWLGIPFGLIYTPAALLTLARGGRQPADLNAKMLKQLADYQQQKGQAPLAARCLEASLQFRDDAAVRQQLQQLRMRLPLNLGDSSKFLAIVGAVFGALAVGVLVGVVRFVIANLISAALPRVIPLYLALFSWATFITCAFIGGLLLFQLVEWVLTRNTSRNALLAIVLALAMASLAAYGILEGEAIGNVIVELLLGAVVTSVTSLILGLLLTLILGGVLFRFGLFDSENGANLIFLVLFLGAAVYYLVMAVATAIRTTRWQQRLS